MKDFVARDGAWLILLTAFDENDRLELPAIGALLNFYRELDLPGLLALGQASEVLLLDDKERLQVAEYVGAQPRGALTLAMVGNFGATLAEQARSLQRVYDMGADVAVVALSLLPAADGLGAQLLELAQLVAPATPLGIYELPEPEHRLLSPAEVAQVAPSGRFFFMKDTCRQIDAFSAKVKVAAGSPLKIFQANLQALPPSMAAGGSGFCGWMPMVAPELCAQVCDMALPAALRAAAQQRLLAFYDVMVAHGFPASAKHILARRGLPIQPYSLQPVARKFFERPPTALDAYIARQNPFAAVAPAEQS